MKKLFFIALVLISAISNAQTAPGGFVPIHQKTSYQYLSSYQLFGTPQDTFAIPAALKSLRWFSNKGDSIYLWSVIQQKWILAGNAGPVGSVGYNGLSNGVTGIDSVQLGGTLLKNTLNNTGSFIHTLKGQTIFNYPYQFQEFQDFGDGTGIVSFYHKGTPAPAGQLDSVNNVRLGVNYTGNTYDASPDLPGFMNDKIGYWIGVNNQGHGSFGIYTDDSLSKTSGIFFHTLDASYKDAITFFGKHPHTINGAIGIGSGAKGFEPYRIMTLKDDKVVQFFGYDSTRSDGTLTRFLGVDNKGNLLVGTGGGGGGGGSTTFAGLTDVNVSSPLDLQLAQYQISDNKWHNHSLVLSDLDGLSYIRNVTLASAAKLGKILSGTTDTMLLRNFKDSTQVKFIQGDTSIAAYVSFPLVEQNVTPLSLGESGAFVYTNSTTNGTFNLPALSSNQGKQYLIKNVSGTKTLTIARAGSDNIYNGSLAETSVILQPGESKTIRAGSSYWYAFSEMDIKTMTVAISDETTTITTGTAKLTLRAPYDMYIIGVRASVNTVSSSGIPTFDINESGTTILSTKLTIDASEKTSVTAATAPVISDPSITDDAEITVDIDVAGTGAKGAKITFYYYKRF